MGRKSTSSEGLLRVAWERKLLAPVVRKVDSAIHWINYYPLNSAIGFPNILWIAISPVDSAIHLLNNRGLAKISIPYLQLRIETGRYDNIPPEERLCNLCNCNRIEDETHFLLDCPSFSSIRDMFFSKLEPKIPFLRLQSHESLLSHLMNSTDYFINIQLISFISTCFELRDKLISGIINPTDG